MSGLASPPRAAGVPARGGVRAWLLAARPPTLTAAVAPVLVGVGLALRDDSFKFAPSLAALFGALALQVGANFANDVADFRRGADGAGRLGPPRATQQGLLTARAVIAGAALAFALAAVAGIYLTLVAGWAVIAIGAVSILAAVAYTAGPWPYGYRGLGELFTFAFFGVLAVAGTYFVQAGTVTDEALAVSLPVALTVSAILVVNNVRDLEADRRAGKRTLAVLLGRRAARAQFVAMLLLAYLAVVALWLAGSLSAWVLLPWLSAPFAIAPARAVLRRADGPSLNRALRETARLHLAFAALLALGITL
ncbi:MAG: 1,4-dihydroxy-2-naphthoate polyprenyltransferase [Dehalococcoidia bacterium]|nr:1,4-dihydroxy-2-naphthoate polyprenyltransferase [Dehalococcoidia bacterium]